MTTEIEAAIAEMQARYDEFIHLRESHDALLEAAKALDAVGAHPPYMDNEFHKLRVAIANAEGKSNAPYGEMCRDPQACSEKGYCPRDLTCGD